MRSTQDQVDRGCRDLFRWLLLIAAMFLVCVAIGIGIFTLRIREHGGNVVREDLFPLIDTATMSDDDKIALRVRVDQLIEAYQAEKMTQDDFIAASLAIREELIADVRADLLARVQTAAVPEQDAAALRARVDELVRTYRESEVAQTDFLAQVKTLREELIAKQPAGASNPAR